MVMMMMMKNCGEIPLTPTQHSSFFILQHNYTNTISIVVIISLTFLPQTPSPKSFDKIVPYFKVLYSAITIQISSSLMASFFCLRVCVGSRQQDNSLDGSMAVGLVGWLTGLLASLNYVISYFYFKQNESCSVLLFVFFFYYICVV